MEINLETQALTVRRHVIGSLQYTPKYLLV